MARGSAAQRRCRRRRVGRPRGGGVLSRPVVVRRIRPRELPRAASLYRDAFAARMTRGGVDRAPPGNAAYVARVAEALVAVRDGEVLGFATVGPVTPEVSDLLGCLEPSTRAILGPLGVPLGPDDPTPVRIVAPRGLTVSARRRSATVNAIAVAPAHRRLGVASALVRAVIDEASELGVAQLFVHSVAGSGSRELFERHGFVPLVVLARFYPDGTGMTFLWREVLRR